MNLQLKELSKGEPSAEMVLSYEISLGPRLRRAMIDPDTTTLPLWNLSSKNRVTPVSIQNRV